MVRLGNNAVLKTLTKTLKFVDADANTNANANVDTVGSTIALCERCSGELKVATSRHANKHKLLIVGFNIVSLNKFETPIFMFCSKSNLYIMKTGLYNFDPLNPTFIQ